MRLTNRKTCSDLKNNAERLKAKGMEVSISDLMYIKLAEYENAEEDADVQPVKHGRWIPQGNDMWLCSNCKENIIYSMHKSDRAEKQRYCSRCGARMNIVYQDDKVTATKVTGW